MAQNPREGFRFTFGGVNLTSVPDSQPPDKYASALNIRAYSDQSIRSRPGYSLIFNCPANNNNNGSPILNIQSYTSIETDNTPRYMAYDANGNVWLGPITEAGNVATNVGNLAGPQGGGASMIPWRPTQSPQTWMYIAGNNDFQKFSAPDANNNVTQYKVGIAEPQIQLEAAPVAPAFTNFTGNASNWNASGTAGNLSNSNIISDTVAAPPLSDPVIPSRLSVPVSINYYLVGSLVNIGNNNASNTYEVQDVIPPIANCNIQAIRYQSGNNGNCIVVPSQLPIGEGPTAPGFLGSLRRGALVSLGGNETVFVQSATLGPNGAVQFVTSTNNTHNANESITGIQTIVVDGNAANGNTIIMPSIDSSVGSTSGTVNTNGQAITWVSGVQFSSSFTGATIIINGVAFQVAAFIDATHLQTTSSAGVQTGVTYSVPSVGGTGTLTQTLGTNPFKVQLGSSGIFPTEDDYIRLVVLINNIAAFVELEIVFTCNTYGTFTFSTTQIPNLVAGELAIIEFPISSLVASGSTVSLADCTSVAVSLTTTGTQVFEIASLCISGGGNPDIGDSGAPYQYEIVPRNILTGAQGNPSPAMRYGVSPRRQNVDVPLPAVSASLPANDAQVTIWDVYRFGGTVTSYRYIGSGLPSTTFVDQYFDDTATAGQLIPTQNYEPFPSVDVPFSVTNSLATITVTGSQIVITGFTAWPATIDRWFPGTLINLGGQTPYTLRRRPTKLSSSSYLFDIEETAGTSLPALFSINEPIVARQINPYVFGPDANGFFFGVGDPLRPGVISYSNSNTPDQVSSTNTNEPTTPSEPLLNGAILDGLAWVASSDRWWTMYPQFSFTGTSVTSQVFTPQQRNITRGLAAPFGITTDKTNIYFWAKDGIGAIAGGGAYTSLTDKDLYTLFPHDQQQGIDITRNGVTYHAPDYSRAATFRLTHINGFLYADYQDSTGTPRTLVCYLPTGAWLQDSYANSMISRCAIAQPEGTLLTNTVNYGLSVMADNAGNVFQGNAGCSDNGVGIRAVVGTFEWDGEPFRNGGLWEDFYLDCTARAKICVIPVRFGKQTHPPTIVPNTNTRQLVKVDVEDGSLDRYMGLQIEWTDGP